MDLLHRTGHHHLHFAFQEEDALGQALHVQHLLDGRALEEQGERLEILIVQVEVEVHVLVDSLKLVGHGLVQKGNALGAIHDTSKKWLESIPTP